METVYSLTDNKTDNNAIHLKNKYYKQFIPKEDNEGIGDLHLGGRQAWRNNTILKKRIKTIYNNLHQDYKLGNL